MTLSKELDFQQKTNIVLFVDYKSAEIVQFIEKQYSKLWRTSVSCKQLKLEKNRFKIECLRSVKTN